jgi:hypothetical protein
MSHRKTFSERVIEYVRQLITDPSFQATYRWKTSAFTRRRKLTFERVLVGLCQVTKMSLQTCLNRFFKALGEARQVATASAFCQARQHLHAGALRALNTGISELLYREGAGSGLLKTWQGHRLVATDCTYLYLPTTPELREAYTVHTTHRQKDAVLALGSCLYDLLNEIVLNFEVTPFQAEKQAIFTSHSGYWQANDITLYDRIYADYSVVAYHAKRGVHFIIRCPTRSSFNVSQELMKSDQMEVQVTLQVSKRTKRFVQSHHLPTQVSVRLVKIPLPNGETEVLMTSLLDPSRYSRTALAELYRLRWGVETYFGRLKNQLEVERFSATKQNGILQEIYACILLSTLGSLLSKEVAQSLAHRPSRRAISRKYRYRPNLTVVCAVTIETLVDLLLSPLPSLESVLRDLHHLMQQAPTPIRPNRSCQRKSLHVRQQLNYWRYKKRIWA